MYTALGCVHCYQAVSVLLILSQTIVRMNVQFELHVSPWKMLQITSLLVIPVVLIRHFLLYTNTLITDYLVAEIFNKLSKSAKHLDNCLSHCISTAYHPQTDGQTEHVNQLLKQYLRCYIDHLSDGWLDHL